MKQIICAAALAAAAAQPCLAQPAVSWKLATGYRAESFHTQNIMQFADDVAIATGGQLKIEVHPNNSLFKLGDIRQAVQDRKVEAGETIMTSLVKDIPIAGADSVPFVVGSYSDAQRLWQLQRPLVEKHFAARGLKPLYSVPWPPQGLFSNKPIRSSADFAGTRMRTYNQTTIRIAELMKAQPVDVAMVEVNKALAEGRMDNMITSAVTGVENKVWGPIRHYYEINAWFPKNIVFVNAKAFDALKPGVKQAVLKAAASAETRGWAKSQAVMMDSTNELRANGIKVERVSGEFDHEIKRLGEKFSREWVRSVGNEANNIFIPYYTQ
ncbi:MAG TPA: TRAP transporter substrate-binding protein [Ramlibacter sp.]|nr:TRAP transporter substrate-binding protein [Ramlibacter sp.]